MRRIAWFLLLIFAFAIPWEYSLDLGEPLGNIARIVGLLLLLVAIPAVLQAGRMRTPGLMQWLVLALYLWFCCTYFWTIEPLVTLARMRGYFQEMMIVWLVWEFAESAGDLRALLRPIVAGVWVLALLTIANFRLRGCHGCRADPLCRRRAGPQRRGPLSQPGISAGGAAGEQRAALAVAAAGGGLPAAGAGCRTAYRFSRRVSGGGGGACGQRSFAGIRPSEEGFWPERWLCRRLPRLLWWIIPSGSFERLATITEQLQGGGLNQRWNIWTAGWHAFVRAPVLGTGAGSFVSRGGPRAPRHGA